MRYRVVGPMRDVVFCHCARCRRTHGHFAAYTQCARDDLELVEERGLRWYESDERRRGFCAECGASVFWEREGGDSVSIAAGTLDEPTGLRPSRHIFTADAGDYYEIADALERR
ncbi:MAG: GFA family protein [Gaiellaceae bacterium]